MTKLSIVPNPLKPQQKIKKARMIQDKPMVIKETKEMGRGVFANADFKKGAKISMTPTLYLNNHDTTLTQHTQVARYVFRASAGQDQSGSTLALGITSMFNHSFNPNVSYHIYDGYIEFLLSKK